MNRDEAFYKIESCHKRGFDVCKKTLIKSDFYFFALVTLCQKLLCYRWISLCCIACYRLPLLVLESQEQQQRNGARKITIYSSVQQQQLIFAKMKHIFQAHLFLLLLPRS